MARRFDAQRGEWTSSVDERWFGFLRACGFGGVLLPNDAATAKDLLSYVDPVGVVLTGGGDAKCITGTADARDYIEEMVLAWTASRGRPLVGVCRGMQVLLAADGAHWVAGGGHVGTRHLVREGTSERSVNSFHHFVTYRTPGFEVLARAPDGSVELAAHARHRRYAIMWHPERDTPFHAEDVRMFQAWFEE